MGDTRIAGGGTFLARPYRMSNDECLMSKEWRIPKPEWRNRSGRGRLMEQTNPSGEIGVTPFVIRTSSFFCHSSLGIRHFFITRCTNHRAWVGKTSTRQGSLRGRWTPRAAAAHPILGRHEISDSMGRRSSASAELAVACSSTAANRA